MSIELAILGLLSWRPLSGYDLKKKFADSLALPWSGNNNQIYTTLVKLHRDGLVTRKVEDPERGPSRKIYSITAQGLAELKRLTLAEPELPQLRHTFLVQLAWADQLGPAELDALLAKYEDEAANRLILLQAQHPHWDAQAKGDAYATAAQARSSRETFLWTAILEDGIAFYENELRWVQELRKALRAKRFAKNRRLLG
jgi:DNA-binding PadR family transcriptional regulator